MKNFLGLPRMAGQSPVEGIDHPHSLNGVYVKYLRRVGVGTDMSEKKGWSPSMEYTCKEHWKLA